MSLFRKFSPNARGAPDDRDMSAIVENLHNVLNTTRGYGSLLADFGISHMGGHMSRDNMAQAVMHDIKECIERYEPRVQLQEIIFEEDHNPLRLSFVIKCTVRATSTSLRLMFDTLLGNIDVEGPANA